MYITPYLSNFSTFCFESYIKKLTDSGLFQISVTENPYLNVDCKHLKTYHSELYRQLVCYPQEVIPTFDMAVNDLFNEKHSGTVLEHPIQVNITQLYIDSVCTKRKGSFFCFVLKFRLKMRDIEASKFAERKEETTASCEKRFLKFM